MRIWFKQIGTSVRLYLFGYSTGLFITWIPARTPKAKSSPDLKFKFLQASDLWSCEQVRAIVWSAALRDIDPEGDLHADRHQPVRGASSRLHVRTESHLPAAQTRPRHASIPRSNRQRRILLRRTSSRFPVSQHLRNSAQISGLQHQSFQVSNYTLLLNWNLKHRRLYFILVSTFALLYFCSIARLNCAIIHTTMRHCPLKAYMCVWQSDWWWRFRRQLPADAFTKLAFY